MINMALPWLVIGAVAIGTAVLMKTKDTHTYTDEEWDCFFDNAIDTTKRVLNDLENLKYKVLTFKDKWGCMERLSMDYIDEYSELSLAIEHLREDVDECKLFLQEIDLDDAPACEKLYALKNAVLESVMQVNDLENMLLMIESNLERQFLQTKIK